MKYILLPILFLFLSIGCKNKRTEDINIRFTHKEAFDSDYLKRNESQKAEKITAKTKEKSIEITIEKYETGGLNYDGKAKIANDTLYLYYWINMDPMDISAVLIPKRFIYEIKTVEYKQIKFEYLGNKFKNK
ncbi:hypothetical protein EV144_106105 [Flavobacterium sp. 270]|uniref:hypothetical protein n=1 Tax=Flavobacterium sp. 270 TaxID=2512114 RepID=UPI00106672A0|nr:hypothetical protein [Flavobacterium sp. 270]TDW46437.1 hypothetical protein EV144_106105 [Flavobacterium sp. 270]